MESYCKVFLILVSFYLICTCLKIYVILSKFIIKAEVCYLLKCYILAVVNNLMLHLVRLSPFLYLSILYFPFTAAGRSWNTPANPKTENSLQLFFSGSRNMTNFWVKLFFTFFILLLLVEKLETILNKQKEWHWFLYSLFLFIFINKNNVFFLISMFLCFALVPKLVQRTVNFHWYWYRILKFWYRDNTIPLH